MQEAMQRKVLASAAAAEDWRRPMLLNVL